MARTKRIKLNDDEQKAYQEGEDLRILTTSPGWVLLVNYLESFGKEAWIDPTEAKDQEDFRVKYTAAWAIRKFALEIPLWAESKVSQADALDKKARGKTEELNADIRIGE